MSHQQPQSRRSNSTFGGQWERGSVDILAWGVRITNKPCRAMLGGWRVCFKGSRANGLRQLVRAVDYLVNTSRCEPPLGSGHQSKTVPCLRFV